MEQIWTYFPELDENQREKMGMLPGLYHDWNEKINLVSRQDMDNLTERHILHSLAIAKVIRFLPDSYILDLGTGGGFPGIPLAIMFPQVQFLMVDGTGKKIAVVQDIIEQLGLLNAEARHIRAEELSTKSAFDFVVSRAVAPLDKLLLWSQKLIGKKHRHPYPNGIFALKGGLMDEEIKALPGKGASYTELFAISKHFTEAFFQEKWVVYVQG